MRLFTLTSDLHGELARNAHNEQFIKDIEAALGEPFECLEGDFSSYGIPGDVIYVRTGGTEGNFRRVYAGHVGMPVRMLTSGKSNSLAASMEIMSWLRDRGIPGEIIHGGAEEIARQLRDGLGIASGPSFRRPFSAPGALKGKRYGVVGRPSDWLISSDVDYASAKDLLGAELIDIPIDELVSAVKNMEQLKDVPALKPLNAPKFGRPFEAGDFEGALKIYSALKSMVVRYSLDGLTLRCFDLLTALGNTGCMSLALLNSEGLIATCEGDIPAMLSMALVREKYGVSGFQANLSKIDGEDYLFAHCTVPLDMVQDYCYDTHFESGIGVALHGLLPLGKARIFKLGADLQQCFDEEVEIVQNPYESNLCRTQVAIKAPAALRNYFLREPLGNHHIIVPL